MGKSDGRILIPQADPAAKRKKINEKEIEM